MKPWLAVSLAFTLLAVLASQSEAAQPLYSGIDPANAFEPAKPNIILILLPGSSCERVGSAN